jgi:hypothetical protein
MGDVVRIYRRHRQDDADIRRAELLVDHGPIPDKSAQPEIALDQGRQGFERSSSLNGG